MKMWRPEYWVNPYVSLVPFVHYVQPESDAYENGADRMLEDVLSYLDKELFRLEPLGHDEVCHLLWEHWETIKQDLTGGAAHDSATESADD